jgi:hypothetical protein
MPGMAVPEETRRRLSRWCADRVGEGDRDRRQISYSIQGTEVTIHDRRPPAYPELDREWSATAVALVRADDPDEDVWSLYLPAANGDGWQRSGEPGPDPVLLLDRLTD